MGVKIEMVEMRDVEMVGQMQRPYNREAEAMREKRARDYQSGSGAEACRNSPKPHDPFSQNPASLELRRMQMLSEIGRKTTRQRL